MLQQSEVDEAEDDVTGGESKLLEPTAETLRAAHCWTNADLVAGDDVMTAFRRQARLHQASWREGRGHDIGHHPYRGGVGTAPIGSRMELNYARASGANFLSTAARSAVDHRLSYREPDQMLAEDRLWADLLSSMPLCFNVFGALHGDRAEARRLTCCWFPEAEGELAEVKFEWSPGRADPLYLGNRSAFDVALLLDCPDGATGVIGIETKYHEALEPPRAPNAATAARYFEVAEGSGAFHPGAADVLIQSDLQQIWQDHLLLLSMLQHPSQSWRWGRFVLVYPERNRAYARAAERYRQLLADASTFSAITLETLLMPGGLEESVRMALRERYLW